MLESLSAALASLEEKRPLIHCITSPIAINDCANAVLALGARPIMAEHPQEVAGITATAKALTVSLANITDARLRSIHISGEAARGAGIPSLIDLVGITCSPMRMEHARTFIADAHPAVIKGNTSEIRAIAGEEVDASSGIDVSDEDEKNGSDEARLARMKELVRRTAEECRAVVVATGEVDLVSDGVRTAAVRNGHRGMARVTGTGCILSCIIGAYLAVCEPFEACLAALVHWGLSGEQAAETAVGLGSYHEALLDRLSLLTAEEIAAGAKVE